MHDARAAPGQGRARGVGGTLWLSRVTGNAGVHAWRSCTACGPARRCICGGAVWPAAALCGHDGPLRRRLSRECISMQTVACIVYTYAMRYVAVLSPAAVYGHPAAQTRTLSAHTFGGWPQSWCTRHGAKGVAGPAACMYLCLCARGCAVLMWGLGEGSKSRSLFGTATAVRFWD